MLLIICCCLPRCICRTKREAEFVENGSTALDALVEAHKELEAEETSARDELTARLDAER